MSSGLFSAADEYTFTVLAIIQTNRMEVEGFRQINYSIDVYVMSSCHPEYFSKEATPHKGEIRDGRYKR